MYPQAYQLKESDESKFYAILEVLDAESPVTARATTEDNEPSNHYLDYFCPFCRASENESSCISCSSLFCHK